MKLYHDQYIESQPGNNQYYYFDQNGKLATGHQVINGIHQFFSADGILYKDYVDNQATGNWYYYDADRGDLVVNQDVTIYGVRYHADANGLLTALDANDNSKPNDHGTSSANNQGSHAASSSSSAGISHADPPSAQPIASASNHGGPVAGFTGGYTNFNNQPAATKTATASSVISVATQSAASASTTVKLLNNTDYEREYHLAKQSQPKHVAATTHAKKQAKKQPQRKLKLKLDAVQKAK